MPTVLDFFIFQAIQLTNVLAELAEVEDMEAKVATILDKARASASNASPLECFGALSPFACGRHR